MRYRMTLLAMIFVVFAGSILAQRRIDEPLQPESKPLWRCGRIVSMAPSITETLYALGLGPRVVGVSHESKFPPEVEDIKEKGNGDVGGYYDPNFEAILALKPDLVIMLEEQAQSLPGLAKLNLETLVVCHKTVDGILESFRTIGRVCGRGPAGRRLAREYRGRLARIEDRTRFFTRPRVLMVLDRILGSGHLADVYVVGADDYFDTIIRLAGGQNAYQQPGVRYPIVSPEGILSLKPDVIVELVPAKELRKLGRKAILDDWQDVATAPAVKNHRVHVFGQDYAEVPGPRFIHFVEDLARTLHPDLDAEGL
jgi:iron complex transport system substrate-binding protein